MKCPTCESCEYAQYCGATEIMRKCERHNKKVEQTNEEWLHTLNTEQLAGFLADKCNEVVETVLSDASCDIGDIDNDDYWYRQADFVEWLKEKHNG